MLGDVAREPADIDWIFRPGRTEPIDWLFNKLFHELVQTIHYYPMDNIKIDTTKIVTDNIWTYHRADGRRILFPWQVEGLPMGTLQMDVVFGERLFAEPILTPISTLSGADILIWSASKELSLAWKLRWLETDGYPQGKDLYDAALLAEQTYLPFELLREVLESSEDWLVNTKYIENFSWRSGFPWVSEISELDWDNFKLEYPWVEGTVEDWHNRLCLALAPTFANLDSSIV
jgi:Nucleotidyl transferase AbiEii toxin, Type IV TA system